MKDSFSSNEAHLKNTANSPGNIPPAPFKIGDKVKRDVPHSNPTGVEVEGIYWHDDHECYYMTIDGEYGYDAIYYQLVEPAKDKINEDTSNLHPHHDLIIAWAKGAEIEYWDDFFEDWLHVSNPAWGSSLKFRIKPEEPKKETIKYRVALFRDSDEPDTWTLSTSSTNIAEGWESENDHFVRWLTDWVEVEV